MNNIFQDEKLDNELVNIFDSDDDFQDLCIDDKVMNTLDKAMEQYGDAKLVLKTNHNQWNMIQDNCSVESYKDYEYLDQDINCISLLEDNFIDANFAFDDPLDIGKESFNISANPMTKITISSTWKLDDTTNVADESKTRNENAKKTTKQQNKKASKSTKKKSNAKKLDLSKIGDKTTTKTRKPRSSGYNRWGREKDGQMLQALRQICNHQNISIDDFWNENTVMSEDHEKVLKDLKAQVHWRRKTSAMLKRIQMLGKDQSLSVRQRILLKKLVALANKNKTELVLEEVADMFPGKSISTLESGLNELTHQL